MKIGPSDFIRQLAHQTQVLACLRWLCEFQVLACIPLQGDIGVADLADLVGVPAAPLRRVLRLLAGTGFLGSGSDSDSDRIAHTALSASFVTHVPLLDALRFLSSSAAPAALQMPEASQRQRTGFALASASDRPFAAACALQPRLHREWAAYVSHLVDPDEALVELLERLDWDQLGDACVVDVDAESLWLVEALAARHAALRFVVQMSEAAVSSVSGSLPPRVTLQLRAPQSSQHLADATVYVLRTPTSSCVAPASWVSERLHAHLGVLRHRADDAMVLLLLPYRPRPGAADPGVEAAACLRSMTMSQLTGEEHDLDVAEIEDLVASVHDALGRLAIVSKLQSCHCATVAVVIKYQASHLSSSVDESALGE